jgi:hypothetical protein
MNEEATRRLWQHAPPGDLFAVTVQEFHREGRLAAGQALLKIDYRELAQAAPFQLDVAAGRVHRRGCPAIPRQSASALYGFWQIGRADQQLACTRCKPVAMDEQPKDRELVSDLLYGLMSIVAQFGGVLRERGQEYRTSATGRALRAQFTELYRELGESERKALDTIAASLGHLATKVHEVETGFDGANGVNATEGGRGNGINGNRGGGRGNSGGRSKRRSRRNAEPRGRQH